jgi:hypothetical protein
VKRLGLGTTRVGAAWPRVGPNLERRLTRGSSRINLKTAIYSHAVLSTRLANKQTIARTSLSSPFFVRIFNTLI